MLSRKLENRPGLDKAPVYSNEYNDCIVRKCTDLTDRWSLVLGQSGLTPSELLAKANPKK